MLHLPALSTADVRTGYLTIMVVLRHARFGVPLLHLTGQGKDLAEHFFVGSTVAQFLALLFLKCKVEMTLARTHCAAVGLSHVVSLVQILNRSAFFRD